MGLDMISATAKYEVYESPNEVRGDDEHLLH
jgi:hypothetical protein